jgi:hypothetical protein
MKRMIQCGIGIQTLNNKLNNLMQLLKKFLRKIWHFFYPKDERVILNEKWSDMQYVLDSQDFNSDFYKKYSNVQEIEHQVGRYLNMKEIIEKIDSQDPSFSIEGDILEFGTWQGVGLIYFARLLGANPNNRHLVGIDSFSGLPHDSSIWKKGAFSDTELNFVAGNILKNAPNNFNNDSFTLIQGWFSDATIKKELYQKIQNVALVHFDADLYSSTVEALEIIEPYLKDRKTPIYFLFDDWGCHPDEVPEAFAEWLEKINQTQKVSAKKISSTRFTRYYKISFTNE